MLDRIEFLLNEAFVSLGRNKWMTFAAISTCAMTLLLLGGLGFAFVQIKAYADSLPSKFEISVFIKDSVPSEKAVALEKQILAIPGVERATFRSREKAWAEQQKEEPEMTAGLPNPLPDGYRIRMDRLEDAPKVAAALGAMPEIGKENVRYLDKEQEILSQILRAITLSGFGLGILMLLTSGTLIYNAIRMAMIARQREIRIMHLIGATRGTVVAPLLIEGIVQGFAGGLIAVLALYGTFEGVQALLSGVMNQPFNDPFPWRLSLMTLMGLGGAYGLICSLFAVRSRELVVPKR